MSCASNLLYYSTNTYLSRYIAETYYEQKYFVWCSPVFDPKALDKLNPLYRIPPSSSPLSIYKTLHDDVVAEDLHSAKIRQNISGLKKGASHHFKEGTIDSNQFSRIIKTIDISGIKEFGPLLYIIPAHLITGKLTLVDVDSTANPLSTEYQIKDLTPDEFDVIQLGGM